MTHRHHSTKILNLILLTLSILSIILSASSLTTNCRLAYYPTQFYLHALSELRNASIISVPEFLTEQKHILKEFIELCEKDVQFARKGLKLATFSWDRKPMRRSLNSATFWLEAVVAKNENVRSILAASPVLRELRPKLSHKMRRRIQRFIKMDPVDVLQHELNKHAVEVQNLWMTNEFDTVPREPLGVILFRYSSVQNVTFGIIALLFLSQFVDVPSAQRVVAARKKHGESKFHTFNAYDLLVYGACLVCMFLAFCRFFGRYSDWVALGVSAFWFSALKLYPPFENYKLLYTLNIALMAVLTVHLQSDWCAYATIIQLYLFPTVKRTTKDTTKAQLFTQRQIICLVALLFGLFLKVEEEHSEWEFGILEPFFLTMEWFSEALINCSIWGWQLSILRSQHRRLSVDIINTVIILGQISLLVFFSEMSDWTYRATLLSAIIALFYHMWTRLRKLTFFLHMFVLVGSLMTWYFIVVAGSDWTKVFTAAAFEDLLRIIKGENARRTEL